MSNGSSGISICMEATLLSTLTTRLEASRQELLDLGLRNPLLNFRLTKAQGVAVVREESAQILEILVKQGKLFNPSCGVVGT